MVLAHHVKIIGQIGQIIEPDAEAGNEKHHQQGCRQPGFEQMIWVVYRFPFLPFSLRLSLQGMLEVEDNIFFRLA